MNSSSPIFLVLLSLLTVWAKLSTAKIGLGSSLTAGDESQSPWLSPSGDFAFGFQQVSGSGDFLVAIWFNKIPEKTITWSANRDKLAQSGSTLSLTTFGLFLSYSNAFTTDTIGESCAYANVLDTGNFVMKDENGNIVWQSFGYPTDTILPSQFMFRGTQLIARLSDTNFSSGRFSLIMQTDGNLVSYMMNMSSMNYTPYFGTPWSYNIGMQVVFNKSVGSISITGLNGNVLGNVISTQASSIQYRYQRAILESDGVFRKYMYPVSNSTNQSMNWVVQDFVPKDICNQIGLEGDGICGYNSYCQVEAANGKPICSCPPGYSFIDENDYMKGCARDFMAQSCLVEENDRFELQEMDFSSFGGTSYDASNEKTESACRSSCLSDCRCDAAIFDDTICLKKQFPLSNGRIGNEVAGKTFVKVRLGSRNTNRKEWDPVLLCWP